MEKDGYTMLFSFSLLRTMLLGSNPTIGPLLCLNLFLVFTCFHYISLELVFCKQDLL
jgi:hypothetical protein